jgi:uncharacterized OsmC-like protein
MQSQDRIREAMERNIRAIELRPSLGRGTAVTRVKVRDGFTCDVEEGRFHLVADMAPKNGGEDAGPNPGIYGRAALGTCMAMGYMIFASLRGIPIDALEIEIQAEYDSRAELGMTGEQPGYDQVRVLVTVQSSASEEDVRRMLDDAEAHSPYLAVFRKPVDVRVESRVLSTAAAAVAVPTA